MGQISLVGQAAALHNLASNGLITRTAASTVAARSLSAGGGINVQNSDGVAGNPGIQLANQAKALNELASNGLVARTAVDTVQARTVTVGNGLSAINGDGVSGNPWVSPVAQFQTITSTTLINAANYTIYFNRGILASNTITISFDQNLPDGFQCSVINVGTGIITLSASPVLNAAGSKTLATQYDSCTVFDASGTIYAIGSIT